MLHALQQHRHPHVDVDDEDLVKGAHARIGQIGLLCVQDLMRESIRESIRETIRVASELDLRLDVRLDVRVDQSPSIP